ncbi:MAG: 3-hydroxyisobutyrate dehydrogenase-like beta-hydroxyacid dehydrogenase [Verrucomicrobiales bacterium]|jgi:3-hydroxyisobutyrate dehydrogenase-like beta-hydroxyacid dehydrogenase
MGIMNDEKPIGIIGLGIIGTCVAQRLRTADRQVYVWSRRARAVPNFLASPAEVARHSEVLQIFVTDGEAALDVINGMLDVLGSQHIVVNSSTISPEDTMKISDKVEATGAAFLDAPFTGSKEAAENAELVYFVGGSHSALVRARPVLELSSKTVLHVGDCGDATAIKLATNIMAATALQGLSEALGLCVAMDVPPEKLAQALEHHGVSSPLTKLKLPQIMETDFAPRFSLANMLKDTAMAMALARSFNLEFPALAATQSQMEKVAKDNDNGQRDFSIIASHYFKK